MQTQSIAHEGKLRQHPLKAWFNPRGRSISGMVFILNRLTGIGLTVYLLLHLVILSMLLSGPEGWDDFIQLARSPFFLALDVVLFFGVLFHGLNGIRIALVGMGIVSQHQRTLIWVLGAVGIILLVSSTILIFTV